MYKVVVLIYYETYGWDANSGYEYYFHAETNEKDRAKSLLSDFKSKYPEPEFRVKAYREEVIKTEKPIE